MSGLISFFSIFHEYFRSALSQSLVVLNKFKRRTRSQLCTEKDVLCSMFGAVGDNKSSGAVTVKGTGRSGRPLLPVPCMHVRRYRSAPLPLSSLRGPSTGTARAHENQAEG